MNLTTLLLKKNPLLRALALLSSIINLPLCILASPLETKKDSIATTQLSAAKVQVADSLFEQGQFGTVLPLYKAQIWQRRQVSARLLLRLAYAEHQQTHYAAEILYLNMALARQPRLSTWRQLANLAQRQRLVGYPTTWQQEIRVQIQRYYYPVLQGLLSVAVVIAVGLILRRSRTKRIIWITYGSYLLGTSAYLYWLRPIATSIVARPGVALMAGPSAGATWLSIAAPGDRLPMLGRQDIWLRVRWQERVAYVRADDTFVIE
ncbi:hypothetical protein FNT36_06590 [Hymenobacter setariae]|uniref:SH3 domain-containing protein n=1 Tax=Hymenobacter setariae TaxID=2594794 RepID=A0A558C4P3_9BACT|nr:hypothetical protein [Hymenobacter setariae]TVT43748.1 hypothetical protein FNT36_06590 [Hymenobacter setariae]